MNKVYKTIMNQASEIEEGATVIESIATKKHCCEEASRVGLKLIRSAKHPQIDKR